MDSGFDFKTEMSVGLSVRHIWKKGGGWLPKETGRVYRKEGGNGEG